MSQRPVLILYATLAVLAMAGQGAAQTALSGATIRIARAAGPITIDGDLSDEGWRGAVRIDTWYETQPHDNTEPKVRSVGYLTYDDRFFYAAFEFEDPNPAAIRAPLGDRDNIGNGFNDYAGVVLDPRNTGRTGLFFVVTPHNIQYDSITDDASGEDASPDFFWESATKITARGWTLEIRIPFASLRYSNADRQTWGITLYRNYPREFHYQFFSSKHPRDGNCFVCRENTLVGLEGLPAGGHLVAAPYVSASDTGHPRDGLGSPLVNDPVAARAGLDVKFTPNADNAVDFTVKPDFSQIESDTAQIAANQRFALFFPEKRPFFLEGLDLLKTPMQAVYTRTITSPDAGARLTGKEHGVTYTVLVADDAGGGSTILPGPNGSSFASQDFGTTAFIARAKRDVGLSFFGVLVTDREGHGGNGHNRVVGPDFQWRPSGDDVVAGQWLVSGTRTPNRPDLADEWTGQSLTGQALNVYWNHNTTHFDWATAYHDLGGGFRADSGFIPQVGYRDENVSTGWTFRPRGLLTRLRTFANVDYQTDRAGVLITRSVQPGMGMDTRWNGFMQFRYTDDRTRAGDRAIGRRNVGYTLQFSPTQQITQITLDSTVGQDIDFDNARPAHGGTVSVSATIHPSDHVELVGVENTTWLNVDDRAGVRRHLFTARVSRLKATYTFTSRLFVRAIGQYVSTDRDPSLYLTDVAARSGDLNGSALFAYKVNWQSVLFIGYGDDRELPAAAVSRLQKLDRQFFVKISYAFQR